MLECKVPVKIVELSKMLRIMCVGRFNRVE